MSAVRRGRKLHDRIAKVIVQPLEMHEGQIRNLATELHPVSQHHFTGYADTHCVPLVDLLETHNIGRRGRLVRRRAAASFLNRDPHTIEASELLLAQPTATKGPAFIAP